MKTKGKRGVRRVKSSGLALTSLMDVLTIILLFLLVNYSDNVSQSDIPQGLILPSISSEPEESKDKTTKVIIFQDRMEVGEETIFFQGNSSDQVVYRLTEILGRHSKETTNKLQVKSDKNVRHDTIDLVVNAATRSGIGAIDFVALAETSE